MVTYVTGERPGDCGSGDFIPEEVNGVGDKGPEDTISVKVETSLVAILEDFHTWGLFHSCQSIRISGGSEF